MGCGWWDKVVDFMGLAENEEDVEEEATREEELKQPRSRGNVLSLHANPEVKIMVVSPLSFDEAEKLAGHLKSRKPVIVNFENTSRDQAQRIIDFLSGAALALNGSTLKITAQTFLFVPSNVSVHADDLPGDLREKLFFRVEQGGR